MTAIKPSASIVENREITSILTALMVDHSLPLWSLEGWDATAGGFRDSVSVERGCAGWGRDHITGWISRYRSALTARRFPRGNSDDAAAPAESAHASVRGDDRHVRCHR